MSESTPVRHQRRRTKGWRMPGRSVYVGRPSIWGNPIPTHVYGTFSVRGYEGYEEGMPILITPQIAVDAFRSIMEVRLTAIEGDHPDDEAWRQAWVDGLTALRGRDLVCWCPLDQPCHADVLLDLANQ